MTLATTTSRVSYPGTGSTGPFAFPFRILADADLLVTKRSSTGVETTLTLTTHYTVAGALEATGSITLVTALAIGETLFIRRKPALTQATSIRNEGQFFAATHEDVFDRLTMQLQSLEDSIARSLKLKETLATSGTYVELEPSAGKVVTGTGTGFTMTTLDSSAVSLPGGGRTVLTLSAYLANNALFNAKDFGALGNGVQDDAAAIQATITAAIAAGCVAYLPGTTSYYLCTTSLTATLAAAQGFAMIGDGLKSIIYSTVNGGDILTVDGTASPQGRTVPTLSDFTLAGSSATRDGLVLNYTHRGTIRNVFVIGGGRWAVNFKSCFLNTWIGGGGTLNVGAVGNIPTQPAPKGMLRLGDGSGGGGSNANVFIGACWEGAEHSSTVITAATNATPIVVTSAAHALETGDVVGISGVLGNTAANGAWIVTKVDANTFSLQGSVGNGAYAGAGTVKCGVGIHIQATTNSYANSFFGGTAEGNNVGMLIGPLCTLTVLKATDITGNFVVNYKNNGTLNNYENSGAGSGKTVLGGALDIEGAFQILGASGQITVDPTYGLRINNALHNLLRILDNRDVIVGDGAIATNATGGFLMISGGAGAPTGVPTNAGAGIVPLYYDTTNNFLYVYNGGWKKSTVYA